MNSEKLHNSTSNSNEALSGVSLQKSIVEIELANSPNFDKFDQDKIETIMGQAGLKAAEAAVEANSTNDALAPAGQEILDDITPPEATGAATMEASYNAADLVNLQNQATSNDWDQERYDRVKENLAKQ